MNTLNIIPGDRLFCLFKGDPKTGKTAAATSFPNPYVFDIDGRIRGAAKMHPGKSIEYDTYTDFWEVCKKIEALNERCDFDTVIISSLTSLANLAIEYSLRYRGVTTEGGVKKKGDSGLTRGNLPLTDVSDWGVEFRGLSKILDGLKSLPCHVIVEAHVLEVATENIVKKTRTVSRSLMTGGKKIAAYLPTAFDEAYHFFVETGFGAVGEYTPPKFQAATVHQGDDWAGTVLNLPPIIEWTNKNFYAELRRYIENPELVKEAGGIP